MLREFFAPAGHLGNHRLQGCV